MSAGAARPYPLTADKVVPPGRGLQHLFDPRLLRSRGARSSQSETRMPDETRKLETAKLLARIDQVVAQSQSLQCDITKKMQQARADHRTVVQPLSTSRPRKRRN